MLLCSLKCSNIEAKYRYLRDGRSAGAYVAGKFLRSRPNLTDISGNVAADFSGSRYSF